MTAALDVDTNRGPRRVLWLAPWFGGLDARYCAALRQVAPASSTSLVTGDAGLTTTPDDEVACQLPAGLRSVAAWRAALLALVSLGKHDVSLLDDTWDPRFLLLHAAKARTRVLVVHDAAPHDAANRHGWAWQRLLKRAVRRRSRHVLCFSDYVGDQVRHSPDFPRLRSVHRVELLPELRPPETRAPVSTGDPYLLVIGRISAYKNVPAVLDAWQEAQFDLVGTERPGRLLIAGVGAEEAVASRPEPVERVESLDRRLSDQEMLALIAGAAAVITYYSHASQSGILSLAAGLGVPAIVSRAGGLQEYQPNAELTVSTTAELKEAMLLCLTAPQDLRTKAEAFYDARLAEDVVGAQLADVLARLCV